MAMFFNQIVTLKRQLCPIPRQWYFSRNRRARTRTSTLSSSAVSTHTSNDISFSPGRESLPRFARLRFPYTEFFTRAFQIVNVIREISRNRRQMITTTPTSPYRVRRFYKSIRLPRCVTLASSKKIIFKTCKSFTLVDFSYYRYLFLCKLQMYCYDNE